MAELAPLPRYRFEDNNGEPLVGGLLFTYEAGTTTPKATFKDVAGVEPNTNPVVLDSAGRAQVRIVSGSYKFVLKDANDVAIWTEDNVQSIADLINVAGALAVENNLDDVADLPTALTNLGLDSVDNTSDADKPVSTATQTALDLKAPIASPTFTGTVAGITKSMVGLGNVDNTSDATKNAATATLTNKTLDAPVIDNSAVFVEESSTPTNPSSGYKKVYPKTDGKLYTLDSAGDEVEVGSGGGGGSGSKNYIDTASAEFESTVGSWATDDGAGSAADYITVARTTSRPVAGLGSLLLTKSANDATGEFAKIQSQTLDLVDRGKALFGSLSFLTDDSNYSSGDLRLQAWDVTNDAELYMGPEEGLEIPYSLYANKMNFTVYTQQTTEEVELRIVGNSTNSLLYLVRFDEVKLGPATQIQAPVVTNWQAYTPVTQGLGTISNVDVYYRRVGTDIHIRGTLQAGSVTANTLRINLPTGLAIDDTLVTSTGNIVGDFSTNNTTVGYSYVALASKNADWFGYGAKLTNTESQMTLDNANTALANNDFLTFNVTLPIEGWGAGALVGSNELADQTIRAQYTATTGSANTSFADATEETVDFNLKIKDPHNAVTTGASWKFTAPRTSDYRVDAYLSWVNTTNLGLAYIEIFKNGSFFRRLDARQGSFSLSGSTTITLNKDEYIEIKASQDDSGGAARTLGAFSGGFTNISIESLPDYAVLGVVKDPATPIDFTPSITNFSIGNGTQSAKYWRDGKFMKGFVNVAFGSTTSISGNMNMTVPGGESIDLDYTSTGFQSKCADFNISDSGVGGFNGILYVAGSTSMGFLANKASSAYIDYAFLSSTIPMTWTTNDSFRVDFKIPISGWY